MASESDYIHQALNRDAASINATLDMVTTHTGNISTLTAGQTALSGRTNTLEDKVGQTIDHGTGQTTGYTLTDNDTHVWGEVGSLDISSLDNPTGGTYMVIFDSGETATTLTLPSNVIWNADVDISVNKRYCLGIIRGLGFFNEFDPGTPVA